MDKEKVEILHPKRFGKTTYDAFAQNGVGCEVLEKNLIKALGFADTADFYLNKIEKPQQENKELRDYNKKLLDENASYSAEIEGLEQNNSELRQSLCSRILISSKLEHENGELKQRLKIAREVIQHLEVFNKSMTFAAVAVSTLMSIIALISIIF